MEPIPSPQEGIRSPYWCHFDLLRDTMDGVAVLFSIHEEDTIYPEDWMVLVALVGFLDAISWDTALTSDGGAIFVYAFLRVAPRMDGY
jgi:hypothetical protein